MSVAKCTKLDIKFLNKMTWQMRWDFLFGSHFRFAALYFLFHGKYFHFEFACRSYNLTFLHIEVELFICITVIFSGTLCCYCLLEDHLPTWKSIVHWVKQDLLELHIRIHWWPLWTSHNIKRIGTLSNQIIVSVLLYSGVSGLETKP